MDAKGLTPILLAVLLACIALSPAKCEGGDAETSATGGLRRRPDGEETMVGRSKFYIVLCFKSTCYAGNGDKTCYCCKTIPESSCFWTRQDCWNYCPNQQQNVGYLPRALVPMAPSITDESHRSINSRAVPDSSTSPGDNL